MLITVLQILFFLLVSVLAYLPYKGKNFTKVSWKKAVALSTRFIICSLLLLGFNYKSILVILNPLTTSFFMLLTLAWFLSPKVIRLYGKYPTSFLDNPRNNMRFIVKFELPSMTIKYFEVIFQQAIFLYSLFVVLGNLQLPTIVFMFTLIVAIFHLGNLLFMHHKWALFYSVLSIPMAILFSYMILQGFVLLTMSIHLVFYLIFNARYWFMENK